MSMTDDARPSPHDSAFSSAEMGLTPRAEARPAASKPAPATAPGKPRRARSQTRTQGPIVPRATVAGRALVAVVAIMTFLASLTIGATLAVRATAGQWRADVTREVTIQIRAGAKQDTDADVELATTIARSTPGVAEVHALSSEETSRLLEPWLGSGLDLGDLPVPRVVVVRLDGTGTTDLARLKRTLTDRIPTATLDDHRAYSRRLAGMADMVMAAGLGLLALVGLATILSVVFATRAAVATNRSVVEVLHFVGARDSFIAAQFQRHFLKIGAEGGLIGGGAAVALFLAIAFLPRLGVGIADPDQPTFIGWLSPGIWGFLGIAGAVLVVALSTALTSRITVYRTLRTIQ